jgi:hypothetical protein
MLSTRCIFTNESWTLHARFPRRAFAADLRRVCLGWILKRRVAAPTFYFVAAGVLDREIGANFEPAR